MTATDSNNPFAALLRRQNYSRNFIVLDGALATELERRGANLDDPLWSARVLLEEPERIREVHYDYFMAGADVAITASYQASYPGFAARGMDHAQATEIMQRSVALAADARSAFWSAVQQANVQQPDVQHVNAGPADQSAQRAYPLIAASIGPYGAFLADGSEYRGDYNLEKRALMDFHRERMTTLAAAEPDLLACETLPCVLEAEALVDLLAETSRRVPQMPPAWISFACRSTESLNSGESFRTAVAQIEDSPHVAAVGVNCTAPIYIEGLLRLAREVTDKPLLVYPNQGETWDATHRRWIARAGAPSIADYVVRWLDAGAIGIGGCCRTGPDDIRQIAAKRHI